MSKSEKTQHIGNAIHQFESYFVKTEALRYKESDGLAEVFKKAQQRAELGMLSVYEDSLSELTEKLKSAVKFRLPDHGAVMQSVTAGKTLPFIINNFLFEQHLPFQSIALEYDTSNVTAYNTKYRASIIYVEEIPRKDKRALLRVNIIKNVKNPYSESYSWSLLKYALEVDFENVNCDTASYFDFVKVQRWDESDSTTPEETIINTQQEIEVLMQFMLALSCKNVDVAQDYPPNPKENVQRAKKGHAIRYQYNTITINSERIEQDGVKRSGQSDGSRTVSPHLRRGHIRRYENKNIWVEATVVKADKADNNLKAKKYIVK